MKNLRTLITAALLLAVIAVLYGCAGKETARTFVLWQLPSQIDMHGNSYVIQSANGKVIVMDGGVKAETPYLRGFLGALGNEVDLWIISHPHFDHVEAFTDILRKPDGIKIKKIMHSEYPVELIELEEMYKQAAYEYYAAARESGIEIVNLTEPGLEFEVDGIRFKAMGVTNPEITLNPYNNSSSVYKVWDDTKSVLFLGDAGVECGTKLLAACGDELDCDYIQMAHHGQAGCDEQFYKTVNFRACLWPTASWIWNNDTGQGYDTGHLKTMDTRRWMDEKGITEHYVSWQGLARIE